MGCGCSKGDPDAPDIDPIDVPDKEPGYPSPNPPTPSKDDVFDPEKFSQTDAKAKQVPDSALGSYEALADHLGRGSSSDMERLRAVFSWLGAQRIKERNYKGVSDPHTPLGYMKLIKKEKGNYPSFFALLCRSMDLPCVILRGESKALTYEPGDTVILKGQWNAVYVDKQWRLVHPFWAFTGVVGYSDDRWTKVEEDGKAMRQQQKKDSGKRVNHTDDFWFLTDPDVFVYFNRATEKPWQLLSKPWTLEDFVHAPYFRQPYFNSGLKLSSEHACVLKTTTGITEVSFKHPEGADAQLGYKLLFDEKMSQKRMPGTLQLDRYVLLNSRPGERSLYSRLPVTGVYKQEVNGGIRGRWPLAEFRLDCERVGSTTDPFPLKPEGGFGFGEHSKQAGLAHPSLEHGICVVRPNDRKVITMRRTRDVKVDASLHHHKIPSSQLAQYVTQDVSGDDVRISVQVPDLDPNPEYALQVLTTEPNGRQSRAAYALLLTHEELDEDDKRKKKDEKRTEEMPSQRPDSGRERLRERMVRATGGSDLHALRAAVLEFEGEGLEERDGDLTRARHRLAELERLEEERRARAAAAAAARPQARPASPEDGPEARLRRAMEGEDAVELEAALLAYQESGLRDDLLIKQARNRLYLLHLKELERAADERDLDKLEEVIGRAERSPVYLQLYNTQAYRRALATRAELRRLRKYADQVLALNKATVAEVYSYPRPRPPVHGVMHATGLLLGEKDYNLRNWEYVQTMMRRTGRQSVLRRIRDFDLVNLRMHTVDHSRRILSRHDPANVCQTSRGAGTFYKWSHDIINEKAGTEIGQTKERRDSAARDSGVDSEDEARRNGVTSGEGEIDDENGRQN